MEQVTIVKIGGNIIDNSDQLKRFLAAFAGLKGLKILVHGGGKLASDLSAQLGIEAKMWQGRRITDAATLRVVTMVYGGLINKTIVALLQSLQCQAIGLTGADANSIRAIKRPVQDIDYGYVGDIPDDAVATSTIQALLNASFTPVFAPITHDGHGQLLNTNADTIASILAVALAQHYNVSLLYCFDKAGVLKDVDDERSVITSIQRREFSELLNTGVIHQGMIPKLHNAFGALEKGVKEVIIGHAQDIHQYGKESFGTRLTL